MFDFLSRFCGGIKKITEQYVRSLSACPCATGIMATLRQPPAMITCCVCEFVVFSQFLLQQLPPTPPPPAYAISLCAFRCEFAFRRGLFQQFHLEEPFTVSGFPFD